MFKIINKNLFLPHVLFWLGILLLGVLNGPIERFYNHIVYGTCHIIPQILASYLTVYYLIPKLLSKKKYIQFFILFLISAYLFSVLGRILVVHVGEPIARTPPFEQESILQIFSEVKWLLLQYFPSTYITVFFFWLITFLNFSRKNLSLEKEKTSTELKMLKSQLNPHFLFNTLNNIYSLSLDNSPKTSESIGRLSKILDYVLYRSEPKFVPLSGEIKMLKDYIALEKLRYDDRLKINFKTEVKSEVEIAPLILLSLVENAFKHGAGEDGGSPKIDISISSDQNNFKFTISNSVVDTTSEISKDAIGLENIKKQLDLIYPNQYELNIDKQANLFTVTLALEF